MFDRPSLKIFAVTSFLLLGVAISPAQVHAAEIKYQIKSFGSDRVSALLQGESARTLSTTISSDGKTVRVSGVNTNFKPKGEIAKSALISSIQQVKRGAFTDLVINLNAPANLGAQPGPSDLQLIMKLKSSGSNQGTAETGPGKVGSQQVEKVKVPIRIFSASTTQNQAGAPGLNIVLPNLDFLPIGIGLSNELRAIAYAVDMIWLWLLGKEVVTGSNASTDAAEPSDLERVKQLEVTTQELTSELIQLRAALSAKEEEIKNLKASVPTP